MPRSSSLQVTSTELLGLLSFTPRNLTTSPDVTAAKLVPADSRMMLSPTRLLTLGVPWDT